MTTSKFATKICRDSLPLMDPRTLWARAHGDEALTGGLRVGKNADEAGFAPGGGGAGAGLDPFDLCQGPFSPLRHNVA